MRLPALTDFSSAIFQTFDIFAALPGAPDLLVEEPGSVFFTDVRYDTQAHEEVKGAKVVIARKALLQALGEFLATAQNVLAEKTIGIESEHFTVAEKKRLTKFRPACDRLKDAPPIVETVSHGEG